MNPNTILQRQIQPGTILPPSNVNTNSGSVVSHISVAPSSTAPSAGGCIIQNTGTMANMKEKTPMCLINELARFNKASYLSQVQHQYRLVDESGPPHKKTFTVVLKLDTEEYTASGPSIKKAQHAAAAIALEQTVLKHPPPKSQRKALGPITPTVELNALAMKRGEPAVYQLIEPSRPQYIPNLNFRGMYQQRYHYPKIPTYYVSLKVGSKLQYFGEGRTAQAARHAAAEEALAALRSMPYPESNVKRPPEQSPTPNGDAADDDDDDSDDLKSPISLVHEIALKRGLGVNFEVTRESGPPHMRTFVTRCMVGDVSTEGEGNGKKVSKKRAAEKMLDELKKLPSLPPAQQKVKKKPIIKKKNRNLIKVMPETETKSDPEYGQGINPISRLIQIQQAKKEREPVYTVMDERGEPRQREFIMQCSLGDLTTNGTGPNKKTAKRNAAEAMLQRMGYSRPVISPAKPPVKMPGIEGAHIYQNQETDKRKMYSDHDNEKLETDGKLGRQLVPGLLLMPDASHTDQNNIQGYSIGNTVMHRTPLQVSKMYQTVAIIAKELLDTGVSPTAEAIRQASHKPLNLQPLRGFKQRLHYLADVMGFHVNFTDFPKSASKVEHICLVSVPISPNQVKHGAGPTIEAAHDQAALGALRSLADLTIDTDKKDIAGDGLYMPSGPAPKLSNTPTDLGSNPKSITAKDSH